MALITVTIGAQAQPAAVSTTTGLAWPPTQPVAVGAPSGLDPTDPYPLRDSIRSIELLSASSPTASPENRVTEYLDSRTETLRALLNQLIGLTNLLPFYFLDRDGESNVTVDNTDPQNPITTAAPSYMRRDLDLGGLKITDLSDATAAQDLVSFNQFQAVQFAAEDDVEQVFATQIIRRDGTITMALPLNLGTFRIENLLATPTSGQHAQPKAHFDAQVTSVQANFLARTGVLAMQADLSFQDTVSSPRYGLTNVGFPTANGDLTNLFFLNEQIALVGANDIPVGALHPFFGSSTQIPANFLLCDGREVSRTVYQNLFLVIGVAYGTPTSVNVFKLPDMRGRTVMGRDNMGGTSANRVVDSQADALGGKLGEELHVLSIGEMAAHTHTYDDAQAASGGAGALQGAAATDADNTVASTSRTTGGTGGGGGHQTMQPSMALSWIIRY